MVIAFSTIPGYVSNRDKERGTWFIQSLCKVISEDVTRPTVLTKDDIFNQLFISLVSPQSPTQNKPLDWLTSRDGVVTVAYRNI